MPTACVQKNLIAPDSCQGMPLGISIIKCKMPERRNPTLRLQHRDTDPDFGRPKKLFTIKWVGSEMGRRLFWCRKTLRPGQQGLYS